MGPHPAPPGASASTAGPGGSESRRSPRPLCQPCPNPSPHTGAGKQRLSPKSMEKGCFRQSSGCAKAPSSMPLPRRSERVERESSPCTPSTLPSLWLPDTKRGDPKGGLFGESPPHPGTRCPCGAPGPSANFPVRRGDRERDGLGERGRSSPGGRAASGGSRTASSSLPPVPAPPPRDAGWGRASPGATNFARSPQGRVEPSRGWAVAGGGSALSSLSIPLSSFHPAAPFPPRSPAPIPLPCSAAGAELCPVLAPPPASPPLRSRRRGAPAPPAPSPPPFLAPGPSSPRGTLVTPEEAKGKKKKLQRGKLPTLGEVGAAVAVPCSGEPRRRRGTAAHLPSAIALFILGVGEGTSGGAK